MAINCPNKGHADWKRLVDSLRKDHGDKADEMAELAFHRAGEIPTPERARELLGPKADMVSKTKRLVADFSKDSWDSLQKTWHPEGRGKFASLAATTMREQMGIANVMNESGIRTIDRRLREEHKNDTQWARAIDRVVAIGKSMADVVFRNHTDADNVRWMRWDDSGIKPDGWEPSADEKAIREITHPIDIQKVRAVQELGTGKLDEARENHFRHFWERSSVRAFSQAIGEAFEKKVGGDETDLNKWTAEARAWVKARVLDLLDKGGGSDKDHLDKFFSSPRPFLKEPGAFKKRVFEDMQTGLDFGLTPVSYNPLDAKVSHWQELDKYIISHTAKNVLAKNGGAKFVLLGEDGPANMQPMSNGVVWEPFVFDKENGKGEETKRIKGTWWVEKTAGQVIENYLSRGLNEKPLFKAYMGAANWMNAFQLSGIMPLFHASFETMETSISSGARGFKAISEGIAHAFAGRSDEFKDSFKYAVLRFKEVPTAAVQAFNRGNEYMKAMAGDPAAPGWAKRIIPWVQMAGGSTMLDRRLYATSTDRTFQLWKDGHYLQSAMTSPFSFVEQTSRPIMEGLVPRMKIGVFSTLMEDWTRNNPDATHEQTVEACQHNWNILEERLGQVVYKRLFINNTAKNLVQALVRAPGWTGGTILQVGRGLVDIAKYVKDFRKDPKTATLTDRAAYTISLIATTAVANAILTALFTGEQPDEHDLLAFRTGEKDEHGNPIRFMLPSYMKDLYAWTYQPFQTAKNKMHPMLSLFSEFRQNKDYYGTEIRHPGDDPLMQFFEMAGYTVKAFEPFSARGFQKVSERSGTAAEHVLPLVGVMPAPALMTASPAQRVASELNQNRMGGQTSEQFQRRQIKRRVESAAERDGPQAVQQAIAAGQIGQQTGSEILKDLRTAPILMATRSLDANGLVEVWDKANDDEKRLLRPRIVMSWMRFHNTHGAEETADLKKALQKRGLIR